MATATSSPPGTSAAGGPTARPVAARAPGSVPRPAPAAGVNGGRKRSVEKSAAVGKTKRSLPLMALIIGLFTFIPVALASYVLFAPETWWKPVYVRVEMEDATPVGAAAEASAKTEAAPAPVQPHAPQPGSPEAALPPLSATETALPAHLGTGVMYQMGTKVVNLADPGGLRYLQVAIVLEFHPAMEEYLLSQNAGAEGAAPEGEESSEEGGAAKGGLAAQIDSRRPIIDDVVMTALSSKRYNDISSVKGKQVLKDELIAAVNRALGFPGVINVYFTEFVVQ